MARAQVAGAGRRGGFAGLPRRGFPWIVAAVALLAVIGALIAVFARWSVSDALRASIVRNIERTTGLSVAAAGDMRLRFLPRPAIEVADVSVGGFGGALGLDADLLRGHLDLVALFSGRFEVDAASLENPTGVVDLDKLKPLLDSVMVAGPSAPLLGALHTGGLRFRDGVIRLRSADPRRDTILTDVTALFAWPEDDAEAVLSGNATWHGTAGDFTVDIGQPGEARRGGLALASMHLKSAVLDLDAEGSLFGSGAIHAAGKLKASTPDLPGLLRLIDKPAPQVAGLREARLSGNASLAGDSLSLDDVTLALNDMVLDGALVVRCRAHRLSLAGTLATDHLDLDTFLTALPPFMGRDTAWSDALLDTGAVADDDIDLRVSATVARLGAFRIEDGSLSLQSGDGRMELSLGEARAYDGLLKGRIVATVAGGVTDVRADATVSRVDLAQFMKDLPGRYQASGVITGHAAVESRGSTPLALMHGLKGRGKMDVRGGEIGGRLTTMLLHEPSAASLVAVPLGAGSAPFDAAAVEVTIKDGAATLGDSWIAWPTARAALSGVASVADQTLGLRAVVSVPGSPEAGTTAFDVAGPWRTLRIQPSRAGL